MLEFVIVGDIRYIRYTSVPPRLESFLFPSFMRRTLDNFSILFIFIILYIINIINKINKMSSYQGKKVKQDDQQLGDLLKGLQQQLQSPSLPDIRGYQDLFFQGVKDPPKKQLFGLRHDGFGRSFSDVKKMIKSLRQCPPPLDDLPSSSTGDSAASAAAATTSTKKPRGSVGVCLPCRMSKVKCDLGTTKEKPCTRCTQRGLSCIVRPPPPLPLPPIIPAPIIPRNVKLQRQRVQLQKNLRNKSFLNKESS